MKEKIKYRFWVFVALLFFILIASQCFATDKYYKSAGVDNNWTNTNNWWTDSTYTVGAGSVPGTGDNAYICAASGNGTLTVNNVSNCLDLKFFSFSGTFGGFYNLNVYGDIVLSSAMTMSYTGFLDLENTSGTKTIRCNGKSFAGLNITRNGAGGTTQMADKLLTAVTGSVYLAAGIFDFNNQDSKMGSFLFSGSGTKTLTLGSGSHRMNYISVTGATNLTVSANTSTIYFYGANNTYGLGSITTWNNLVWDSATIASATITGSFTCNGLTIRPQINTVVIVSIGDNITVNTALTLVGKTREYRLQIRSTVTGTQRTITNNGTLYLSRMDFMDMNFAGSTAWSSGTSFQVGDLQGNSVSAGTEPLDATRTLYWVATSGGLSYDTTSWATTSGGSTKVAIPLAQDSVIFDANSITTGSRTITFQRFNCKGFDATNLANNPTLSFTSTDAIYGNLKLGSSQTISGSTAIKFRGRAATHQITTAGKTITFSMDIDCYGGTYKLQDNYTNSGSASISFYVGTLDLNGYNLTTMGNITSSSCTGATFILGSGTWTHAATNAAININDADLVITAGTSKLKLTGTIVTAFNLLMTGKTLNVIEIRGVSDATKYITIAGASGTIDSLILTPTVTAAHYIRFNAGSTITVNTFIAAGASGNVINILSNAASNATISLPSGCPADNGTDWCAFTWINGTGAGTWKVGANSTLTNCTGLTASSCAATAIKAVNTVTQATINKVNTTTKATIKKINGVLNQ